MADVDADVGSAERTSGGRGVMDETAACVCSGGVLPGASGICEGKPRNEKTGRKSKRRGSIGIPIGNRHETKT